VTSAAATTLRSLLATSEAALRQGPHPDRARLDAESLLLHLLHQNRAWLLAHSDDPASPETQSALATLITRRQSGEPLQYITGHAEFFGLSFAVAPGVLIPRPETEHLVEEVQSLAQQQPQIPHLKIADVGTGSGAIAIALAHQLPQSHLTAVDLSPQALAIARENARQNQVADRITFLEGDLLAPLAGQSFNIIVSNPPYIPLSDLPSLSVEVRDHEPHSALFAGTDGLAIYQCLIPDAYPLLHPGGWLALEIGYGQQPAIAHLLQQSGYTQIHFLPDYQGIPRVATAQRPA
jgi:release factor glutamine methyltransferase